MMLPEKMRILLFYLIFVNPPDNKQASGFVTGKIQFYRSKYFDEKSIHADIGRDMNVVCNHVKAFNARKQNNRDSDVISFANDDAVENRENNEVMNYVNRNSDAIGFISENIAEKGPVPKQEVNFSVEATFNSHLKPKELGTADLDKNNVEQPKQMTQIKNTQLDTQRLTTSELTNIENDSSRINSNMGKEENIYKREVTRIDNPDNIMELEGQGNMAEKLIRQSQTAPLSPHQSKRQMNGHSQKQYITPEEALRKKNLQLIKQNTKSLDDNQVENQYQNKLVQELNRLAQNSDSGQPEISRPQNYQPFQEHTSGMSPQSCVSESNQVELKEHPMISKLFAKQRQIENLKQLLMQVESKFQMEVNEVGRLQQSVSEAEKELDEAVRLMQDVKMRNIKGLQHIEAAQDAAGRNLESKALKAHAEESQLAMHDQVLFSERQRLNALRAQMIFLQTELASAQNSGILTFEDGDKTGFQPYGYHYKSPSLSESLKYFQSSPSKQVKSVGPYMNNEAPVGASDSHGTQQKSPYLMLTSDDLI